jgi:hypothetical protein
MTAPKLVLVEWLDAHAGRGWQTADAIREAAEPLYCRSVGWLVRETADCKVLVPHISGERDGIEFLTGSGDLTIPAKAIVRFRVLKC